MAHDHPQPAAEPGNSIPVAHSNGTHPPVNRDENGTVHLPTHRKRRVPALAADAALTSPSHSLSSPPPSSTSEWRHDRPPKRQPNYHLPSLIPSTPVPVPAVAAFFMSSAQQMLLLLIAVRGSSPSSHGALFVLTTVLELCWLLIAWLSLRWPAVTPLLWPLTLLPTLLFPPTFPLYTYLCSISTLTYLPHLVALAFQSASFSGWDLWMRVIFVFSYIDIRDCSPIAAPAASSVAASSHRRATTWAELRPYVLRDVQRATVEELKMAATLALLYWLPACSLSHTASLLLQSPLSSSSLLSLLHLYSRYVLTLLLTASTLALIDQFYSLIFLSLSLRSFPSQQSPLSAPSLASFWGGRWNRTVHSLLFHSLYLPTLASSSSPDIALVAAFTGSAVLHAYPAWVSGMQPSGIASVCLFFLLHALLTALEKKAGLGGGLRGRLWLWLCLLLTLPLICEPFFLLLGGEQWSGQSIS